MAAKKVDEVREKAFHQALTSGDLLKVESFLDEGFSVHHRSESMPEPMACAINKRNVELVRLLLRRGYDINQPLGQLSLRTALMQALNTSREVFECLLAAGPDLNVRDKYGSTLAQILAASLGDDVELLAGLSAMGSRLDVVDNYGETLFTQANRYGNLKCAEFLLHKGVDVNERGRDRMTSLIIAGQKGLLEVCQWLISKGADIHAKDDFNKTALDWARANNHTNVVEFLEEQLTQHPQGRTPKE